MRFWDASAIVPLLIDEPGTRLARGWLRDDPGIVTWALTRLEVARAVERRFRERRLSGERRRTVLRALESAAERWDEVSDVLPVRSRALALLARHALRAADAAQLGAALLVAEPTPQALTMVCFDRGLADAARREGLAVLSWPDEPVDRP